MSYIAAGVTVGAGLSAVGGMMAGNAASKAAKEQQAAAAEWMRQVKQDKNDALSALNTPATLAAYDISLHSQERNVQRMETLAQNMDPALVSAGKQAYDLLQGKSAPVLQNIQNQRSLQRTQMLDSLRQQLGPGAETSSAGMQAMQKFDADTANMMSGAQQQYLQQVSNISLSGVPLSQSLGAANESLDKISLNSPGAQAADMIAKYTGLMGGAQAAVTNAAGGEQKGAQLQGQMMGQLGNTVLMGTAMYAGNRSVGPDKPPGGTPPEGPAAPGSSGDYMKDPLGVGSLDPNASGSAPGPLSPGTLGGSSFAPRRTAGVGIPAAPYAGPLGPNYNGYSGYSHNVSYYDPSNGGFGGKIGIAGGGN